MFDSALLLDRPHASRLQRIELATLVLGAHALAMAALIAAQAWRVDPVPFPSLPAPPLEPTVVVDFAPEPPKSAEPARRPTQTAVTPAPLAAPIEAATPEQLADAAVPSVATEAVGGAGSGEGTSLDGGGPASGDPRGAGTGAGEVVIYEGSNLTPPVCIVRVDPKFPRLAQIQRRNGSVLLRAEISADGRVRGAEVLQASPAGLGFEESALDAVRQWRFRPATRPDGRPAAVLYRPQVTFLLR